MMLTVFPVLNRFYRSNGVLYYLCTSAMYVWHDGGFSPLRYSNLDSIRLINRFEMLEWR